MRSVTPRALHRALGVTMLLPLLAWAVTGAIFFVKPGYGGAYESLAVRTYPLTAPISVPPSADWREVRYLRTVLDDHLIARTESGWKQLDPVTLQERPSPTDAEVRALVTDAFTVNPERYGQIATVEGSVITTVTGVRVTFDWDRLSLSLRGRHTRRIDAVYRVHYLQWTGVVWLDKVLGGLGLFLIVALSAAGVRLLFRRGASGNGPMGQWGNEAMGQLKTLAHCPIGSFTIGALCPFPNAPSLPFCRSCSRRP